MMAFPQRGPGVGKLMGGINMLGFFFFKKKYSTVIPTKNLFEVKSGVRTIGERVQKTQLVMDLWAEKGRQTASPCPFPFCPPASPPRPPCAHPAHLSPPSSALPFLLLLLSLPSSPVSLPLLLCFHFLLFLLFLLLLLLLFPLLFTLSL